ncbi:hypothetical protein VHEMI05448 [[Torrubiella] hemipterigena]|uniref:Uncharacterized protein n=1 Tax=[Torrubiella] hemipterigena TaxID=1531966 RepID=A0A0A1TH14_9HYPO|nr:hypothetical protein VHEMI05448 [[Torrubiella] hemipterigena]
MSFPFKTVLVVGATSGIGLAMAERFVQEGKKVIAVGRRQDRLDAFVQKHGAEMTDSFVFDITNTAGLDAFVADVTKKHPDLDCVYLNAGYQRPIALTDPASVNLDDFHYEINLNFTCNVNLCIKFLPHLKSFNGPSCLMITGTHISVIPAMMVPAYSAAKAAARAFFDCLRAQNEGSNVRFVDIGTPLVQTELHDYMGEERGRAMGMPVNAFVDQVFEQLEQGKEEVVVGVIGLANSDEFKGLLERRHKLFMELTALMRQAH